MDEEEQVAFHLLTQIEKLHKENERLRAALIQCVIIAEQYQRENETIVEMSRSKMAKIKARAVAARCGMLFSAQKKVARAALAGGKKDG